MSKKRRGGGKKGRSGPPGHTRNRGVHRGGAAGRSGPPGHMNSMKHGVSALATSGRVPEGAEWIHELGDGLGVALRDEVKRVHRSVSLARESTIGRAVEHEKKRLLYLRYFHRQCGGDDVPATITETIVERTDGRGVTIRKTKREGMTLPERTDLLDKITKAVDARDRAISKLELGTDGIGPKLEALEARLRGLPDPDAEESTDEPDAETAEPTSMDHLAARFGGGDREDD